MISQATRELIQQRLEDEVMCTCGGCRLSVADCGMMNCHGREGQRAIIAHGHVGAGMAPARGLSISFPPFRDPSVHYRALDFARRTRWADFLDAFLGAGRSGGPR